MLHAMNFPSLSLKRSSAYLKIRQNKSEGFALNKQYFSKMIAFMLFLL